MLHHTQKTAGAPQPAGPGGPGQQPAQQLNPRWSLLATGQGFLQRAPAPSLDYKGLAKQIFKAIDGPGTDEEAVYRALEQLRRNPDAIAELKKTYQQEHKLDLIADIRGDFSEGELEYALQLLSGGSPQALERIDQGTPHHFLGLTAAVERIWAAVDIAGTEEEAIYAVLLPFGRHTQMLELAFEGRYQENLRDRLDSELSGSEFDHAFELLSPKEEQRYFPAADWPLAARILADLLAAQRPARFRFRSRALRRDQEAAAHQPADAGIARTARPSVIPKASRPSTAARLSTRSTGGKNIRVNKAARNLWAGPYHDPQTSYYYVLSVDGYLNPYFALTSFSCRSRRSATAR